MDIIGMEEAESLPGFTVLLAKEVNENEERRHCVQAAGTVALSFADKQGGVFQRKGQWKK